jgi:hypothetical protein
MHRSGRSIEHCGGRSTVVAAASWWPQPSCGRSHRGCIVVAAASWCSSIVVAAPIVVVKPQHRGVNDLVCQTVSS